MPIRLCAQRWQFGLSWKRHTSTRYLTQRISHLGLARMVIVILPSRRSRLLSGLVALLVTAACGFSNFAAEPPATLQVRLATVPPTATMPPNLTPTPPTGVVPNRPVDPAVGEMLAQVQSDRLMVTVGTLSGMFSRHVLSTKDNPERGIGAARDWLLAQFNRIRTARLARQIEVWTQPVQYTWGGGTVNVTSENVVAVFPGTDVGAGVIVIGAHYDTITTNYSDGKAYAPGANDNASGVAAMLETAEIMAGWPCRATLVFVAFTAEETGRQGSLAFVKNYLQAQNSPIPVRAMLNLDIIGSEMGANGEIDRRTIRLFSAEPNDSPSRQLARQMTLIINTYMDDANPVVQSAEERTGRWGDHQSFSAAGYPAVRLIQSLEDPTRQHSARDTIEGIQPAYLMRTTRAALASVAILAGGPPAPADMSMSLVADETRRQTLVWLPVSGAVGYLVALRQTSSVYYDQVITVQAAHQLTWDGFGRYAAVAVAAFNAEGRMGPFSPERPLANITRK